MENGLTLLKPCSVAELLFLLQFLERPYRALSCRRLVAIPTPTMTAF
jgi:hypothetical protein